MNKLKMIFFMLTFAFVLSFSGPCEKAEAEPVQNYAVLDSTETDYAYSMTDDEDVETPLSKRIIMALVFGVVGAIFVSAVGVGSLKSELKSVHKQTSARNYIAPGTAKITGRTDAFLYSKETKTELPKQQNRQ